METTRYVNNITKFMLNGLGSYESVHEMYFCVCFFICLEWLYLCLNLLYCWNVSLGYEFVNICCFTCFDG